MQFVPGQKISWISFGKRMYGTVWKEWKSQEGKEDIVVCAIAETEPCQGIHFHPKIIEDEVKIE